MTRFRVVLASCSMAILVAVVGVALTSGPGGPPVWLLFCGILAVAAGLQGVTSEPKDLTPALVLSLPPVVALAAEGSPTWLIGPLSALLLLSAELQALSWECRGTGSTGSFVPRRLLRVGVLVSLGLVASVGVEAVAGSWAASGTTAVALAAAALALLGLVVFSRSG